MTSLLKISRLGVERDYMNLDHHMVTKKTYMYSMRYPLFKLIRVKFVLKKFYKNGIE